MYVGIGVLTCFHSEIEYIKVENLVLAFGDQTQAYDGLIIVAMN